MIVIAMKVLDLSLLSFWSIVRTFSELRGFERKDFRK
jgi:hypothetical protein